jgi:hypothetical protein
MQLFSVGKWRRMVLGLAALAVLAGGQAMAQEAALPPPPWTKEAAYLQAPPEKRERWEKAWERLLRLRGDCQEAMDEQIKAHLDPLFEGAKAPAFAQDVLGAECKVHHALGVAEKFLSDAAYGIGQLFGAQQTYQPMNWADRFDKYAKERFAQTVLSPEDVQRTVDAAVSG